MSWFQRLSTLDAAFLAVEDSVAHMHVGAVLVLDAAPLTLSGGGLDFERVRTFVCAQLAHVPRYRQRVAHVPMLRHPVWVDDERFNIHYHLRHTALPRPGDERQLKRLAGRIFSQPLDRNRPLWEIWVVEGLTEGRFGVISKVHHCMIDGVSGMELVTTLLSPSPDAPAPVAAPWTPRPMPTPTQLLRDELSHRATGVRRLLGTARGLLRAAGGSAEAPAPRDTSGPPGPLEQARKTVQGLAETAVEGVIPASRTPLWGDLGPHRRFDVARFELARVKAVKDAVGGKLNDVVLATVAGALRRFFARRGTDPDTIDDFRAFVPVSVRDDGERGALGNRVSMMLAHLPIAEPDPSRRYQAVVAETTRLKRGSGQVRSGQVATQASDWTGTALISAAMRVVRRLRPYNIVVTNVPGPPARLYLLGAEVQAIYPLVPLYGHQCVGVALFSYADALYWGVSADWELFPDLRDLIEDLSAAFEELEALAAGGETAAVTPDEDLARE